MKTLIVCASRYGSTLKIGEWIKERLPWQDDVDIFPVEDAPEPENYDIVMLGGGVYNEQVDKRIVSYAGNFKEKMKDKKLVLFAVCLDTKSLFMRGKFFAGWMYLQPLLNELEGLNIICADALSGEINPTKLNDKDKKVLMSFYNKILKRDIKELPFHTKMNKLEVWQFAEKIIRTAR